MASLILKNGSTLLIPSLRSVPVNAHTRHANAISPGFALSTIVTCRHRIFHALTQKGRGPSVRRSGLSNAFWPVPTLFSSTQTFLSSTESVPPTKHSALHSRRGIDVLVLTSAMAAMPRPSQTRSRRMSHFTPIRCRLALVRRTKRDTRTSQVRSNRIV